jgi:hypothetical protein
MHRSPKLWSYFGTYEEVKLRMFKRWILVQGLRSLKHTLKIHVGHYFPVSFPLFGHKLSVLYMFSVPRVYCLTKSTKP